MPHIRIKPEQFCPLCGGKLRLVQPGAGQDWNSFWSCLNYPSCRGRRQVIDRDQDDLNFWEARQAEYIWIKR